MVDLIGFTIFRNDRGWQLSTQLQDQFGWTVRIIPDYEADVILNCVRNFAPSSVEFKALIAATPIKEKPVFKRGSTPAGSSAGRLFDPDSVTAALPKPKFVRRS